MKGLRWVVLAVIIFASFAAYVLRTNFNIVSATMIADLGMNEYQLGMVFSAFAAGYALFQFFRGHHNWKGSYIFLIAELGQLLDSPRPSGSKFDKITHQDVGKIDDTAF